MTWWNTQRSAYGKVSRTVSGQGAKRLTAHEERLKVLNAHVYRVPKQGGANASKTTDLLTDRLTGSLNYWFTESLNQKRKFVMLNVCVEISLMWKCINSRIFLLFSTFSSWSSFARSIPRGLTYLYPQLRADRHRSRTPTLNTSRPPSHPHGHADRGAGIHLQPQDPLLHL